MNIAREICMYSFYTFNSGLPCVPVTAVISIDSISTFNANKFLFSCNHRIKFTRLCKQFRILRYQNANHAAKVDLIWPISDMAEEILQQLVAHGRYLRAGVREDGEERVEELGKKPDGAGVRYTIQHTDPGDEELSDKPGQGNYQ